MFKPLLACGLVLIYATPGASVAQSPAATAPASTTQANLPLAFRSAMDGYKPYTDEATLNWRQANDTTAQIGGWRVYAKEASQPKAREATLPADVHSSPAKPPIQAP